MNPEKPKLPRAALAFLVLVCCGSGIANAIARPSPAPIVPTATPARALPVKRAPALDDSTRFIPAHDLLLDHAGQRKAEALTNFIEGARLEQNGEIDSALTAYQKVLTVDPGEIELASRVASLLTRQEDFPRAIDVLKDATKANPKEIGPYLQLSFLYAKYLRKPEQALKYANQAIAIDPENIDGYQRIYEISLTGSDAKGALAALDRAVKVNSQNPAFWTRLGKLYASLVFEGDTEPKPEDLKRVNAVFQRAAESAADDATVLKDVADYFAASQQIDLAIPLYIRVLELQPDDASAREKLATGFLMTNQRVKAVEMLQEIIKKTPEKYQPYELLAQLLDDEARALLRANQTDAAKAEFAKAAAQYEQSLLINPTRAHTYLRLAELWVGPLKEAERAVTMLTEGRLRFPRAPEFTYLLAIAQREAKQTQQAVIMFEEALNEAQSNSPEMLTARFYFDYGAAADQAGFYDKAADLLRSSIALDTGKAAEAYNYLAYMFADHNIRLDEAEEAVKQALALDPDNGAYLDTAGWVNFRKGRYDDALRDLLRAEQSLTRSDPVVYDHIGDTYAKLNRVPQALEYWEKAIVLDPGNKTIAEKVESTKTTLSKGGPVKPLPRP